MAEISTLPGSVSADPTGGRPVLPTRSVLRPLGLHEVRIVGGFWGRRQRVNAEATLGHCRSWMDKLGWTGNFTAPAGAGSAHRRGREFSDSEVYKLVEAMAWEVGRTGDLAWDAEIAELTGAIAAAQAPDGYLNTAFGGPGQRPRYSDLQSGHELYCTGHLLQAAVARARTEGDDPLVQIARRAADQVCDAFGPQRTPGICGHPQIEPALVELARLTGEQRYLDQAALFLRRRGHRTLPEHPTGWSYFQDDIPVREAEVLRGHAVRALYLSCGAVDVAVETGDSELRDAVAGQFARTLARRTYLTGGMGSRHEDEAFGDDFALPADRAYAETCAGVASVMLAWRLLLATGDTRYADFIERVLYNVLATSIADDGRSFFYANTLHQRVPAEVPAPDRERLRFGGGGRAPWFEVSCCLSNLARLLASLGGYLATVEADTLRIHQYADVDLRTRLGDGRRVGLQVRTRYPDDGVVTVRIVQADGGPWALGLRVPAWAGGAVLADASSRRPVSGGQAVIRRAFTCGEEVRLELPIRPRWIFPDPRIDAVRGCAAVERGPVVLCAESVDQPGYELDDLRVDTGTAPEEDPYGAIVRGRIDRPADAPWPYRPVSGEPRRLVSGEPCRQVSGEPRRLVSGEPCRQVSDEPCRPVSGELAPAARQPGDGGPIQVRLVPYHRWARRGPSTMRVWLPEN